MTTTARTRTAKKATASRAKVDPPKVDDLVDQSKDGDTVDDERVVPADELEQGAPERTVDAGLRNAAAERPVRSRRARRQEALAQATEDNPVRSGKVSVAQAAEILRIYESEVHSVDKTDAGIVATTTDGQHYLLLEDGFVWLEHPEQPVGR